MIQKDMPMTSMINQEMPGNMNPPPQDVKTKLPIEHFMNGLIGSSLMFFSLAMAFSMVTSCDGNVMKEIQWSTAPS